MKSKQLIMSLFLLSFSFISTHAFHSKTLGDLCKGESDHSFCSDDMYFSCKEKNGRFSAILNLQTLGNGDLLNPDRRLLHKSGHLQFDSRLWVTDNLTGEKSYIKSKENPYNVTEDISYYVNGELEYVIKAGETILFKPTVAHRIIYGLGSEHSGISVRMFRDGSSLRRGGLFVLGEADNKEREHIYNTYVFYADPILKDYYIFWSLATEENGIRDIKVYESRCRKTRLK